MGNHPPPGVDRADEFRSDFLLSRVASLERRRGPHPAAPGRAAPGGGPARSGAYDPRGTGRGTIGYEEYDFGGLILGYVEPDFCKQILSSFCT